MKPVLVEIGGFTIYSYGFMLALALLVASLGLLRQASREGFNPDHVLEAVIAATAAGLIGARLLYVFLNWELYQGQWIKILFTRSGGLSFYGAFLGGLVALFAWCRFRKLHFLKLTDLMAPYLALGYALGRVGCFLNGCCYGTVSSVPWALPASAADRFLRHPVQLYASLGGLVIFIILYRIRPKRPFEGFQLIMLALLYGCLRFITEFYREEPQVWHGLTFAQTFSLGLALVSLLLLLVVFVVKDYNKNRANLR
ncbi:MAG TPA: prolipoprotein diacylglyceryl transferase [Firmicutes bacterium]|nr:prolipoprotein diacylglyceryl transferase [Bacillota bacterium]